MANERVDEVGNWGRWGAEDELGARNLVTSGRTLAATRLCRTGQVISLGTEVGRHGFVSGGRNVTWHVTTTVELPDDPGRGRAEDMLMLHTHAHTHMDGLAHVWYDGQLYNGFPATTIGRGGTRHLSIGNVGGLATHGVLLDVTAGRSKPLDIGEEILADDLEAAAERAGVEITPGACVLVRTGWYDVFAGGDRGRYASGEPGLGVDGARWLLARDPAVIGVDNWGVEIFPPPSPDEALAVHELVLRDHGVYLVENLDLRRLADSCTGPFLFAVAPLPIDRGLGSPVNPIVIL